MNFLLRYFAIFFAVFAVSACTPFVDYHASREPEPAENIANQNSELAIQARTGTLAASPNESLDAIVSRIEKAKTRVLLATYILSEKRIIKALQDAHVRGVEVQVLLEPNVYNLPTINQKAFDQLIKSGVTTGWIRSSSFGLHHAKYLVIDDEYVISTANMSHSSFVENREFFWIWNNMSDTATLVRLFEADTVGAKFQSSTGAVSTSPETSRASIESALRQTKKSLRLAIQSMSDPSILSILQELRARGVDIAITLGGADKVEENALLARNLSAMGIRVRAIDRPYIHAKAFVVDDEIVYIGSVNFTPSWFDANRETGILFANKEVAKKLSAYIDGDISKAENWHK